MRSGKFAVSWQLQPVTRVQRTTPLRLSEVDRTVANPGVLSRAPRVVQFVSLHKEKSASRRHGGGHERQSTGSLSRARDHSFDNKLTNEYCTRPDDRGGYITL